ncbi:hypothetical protein PLUA15_90113 [Pseudomonas lundensis]|uniref:Transposase n=1 Tax=Pseudomonas lundensis TaxID=86185 RepID=A0AAX2HEV1_9PSED|nr:hypothetical protein PLUA15_90113 [Pseudomonas lundensis]
MCSSVTSRVTGRLGAAGQPGCKVEDSRWRLLKTNSYTFLGLDGCTPNKNGLETVDRTIRQRLFQE